MKRRLLLIALLGLGCTEAGPQTSQCQTITGACEDEETLTMSWTLRSRGFEFGCAAFVDARVELEIGDKTVEAPCSDALAQTKVPEDEYVIRGALVSGGEEFRTATKQVDVNRATSAELEFRFDDFALGSEFAASFD